MTFDREEEISVIAGKYRVPMKLGYLGSRIFLQFRYNKVLIEEIKVMESAKWHGFDKPPMKMWSIQHSIRNQFALSFLMGNNPYALYQYPLDAMMDQIRSSLKRPAYDHQVEMCAHAMVRKYSIICGEMGTGKTLAAIEAVERLGLKSEEILYVGPKSGVQAVSREFRKWESPLSPRMMTYEKLVRAILDPTPRCVIFDESSKIKNPNSQRSMAALALAHKVRDVHGKDGYVMLLSGTPAPRTPVDWWHQGEVACPGYIRESDLPKFRNRLCMMEERESLSGGVYPHLIGWLDDSSKCVKCLQPENHEAHLALIDGMPNPQYHAYGKSVNEVERLYRRMKGLVLVKFKKDCLDLPEKQYRIIEVKPTVEIIRKAQMILKTSPRAITALSLMRELSDGFQYTQEEDGHKVCDTCSGKKTVLAPKMEAEDTQAPLTFSEVDENIEREEVSCPTCGGSGLITKYKRSADIITTPKDEVLSDLLDDHEEVGRLIVWGGFTETIDKIIKLCHSKGWATLRVDRRGYHATDAEGNSRDEQAYLDGMDLSHPMYRKRLIETPKLCFVGNAKAGGMALTLTGSPTEVFYSNSFDGEARMQAEDRFHRAGMDTNRGATIIDIIHLPSDKLVLDNLKKKKRLQNLTMGELAEAIGNE